MTFEPKLFADKTVVVIGGTSGIGAATAEAFSALGAWTHVAGLMTGAKAGLAGITASEVDVRSTADLESYISVFESIDVLVNCAGVSRDRDEWTSQSFAEVMSINLYSILTACRTARPRMPAGSAIVNIASMYSTFGSGDRPAYASSKGAVVQLTKSLAQEYAPAIRVNAVAPGWIVTPLSKTLLSDTEASGPILARIPFGRWGEPKEIADPIVYLASPAAGYITGAILPIDGGYLTV